MSTGNSSEEKNLPASLRKLQELRRKGQVSSSQDFISAAGIIGSFLYLWIARASIGYRLEEMLTLPRLVERESFVTAARFIAATLLEETALILLPLAAIGVGAAILANFLIKRGAVLSGDPVKPRPERLNPVAGLKNLFSLRSVVNFIKGLTKLILLTSVLALVILFGLNRLMTAPSCGVTCLFAVGEDLLRRIASAAAGLFLLSGLLDIWLQRWLFLRDMRMTKTEFKRELKEREGDPLLRKRLRQRRHEVLAASTPLGAEHATFFIGVPGGIAVGLRYRRSETPVPIAVCKATGRAADVMLDLARKNQMPIEINRQSADRLARYCRVGEVVPEALYDLIADVIVRLHIN